MVEIILTEPQLTCLKAAVPGDSDECAALAAAEYFAGDDVTAQPIAVAITCTKEIAKRLLEAAQTSCPNVVPEIRAAIQQKAH